MRRGTLREKAVTPMVEESAPGGSPDGIEIRGRRWNFTLATGHDLERQACDQLRRLLAAWDVDRWVVTISIRIDHRVRVPHSHPVLTLNTAYLDRDDFALAMLLHEQLHWFEDSRAPTVAKAIEELRRMYPHVPSSPPEGARDAHSTYLHLIVNWLEYESLRDVLGEARARRVLDYWTTHHYKWIYRTVLQDDLRIGEVVRRHHLIP